MSVAGRLSLAALPVRAAVAVVRGGCGGRSPLWLVAGGAGRVRGGLGGLRPARAVWLYVAARRSLSSASKAGRSRRRRCAGAAGRRDVVRAAEFVRWPSAFLDRAPPTWRKRAPPAPPRGGRPRRRPAHAVIGLFPEAGGCHERRHRRLRLGQSALRRQGVRTRRARKRARRRGRGDRRSRMASRAPTASCCRASAPSPIAGAGSTRCPAWSRRSTDAVRRRGRPFLGICVGMQLMADARPRERGRRRASAGSPATSTQIAPARPGAQDPADGLEHARRAETAPAVRRHPHGPRACTPISCIPISSTPAKPPTSSPTADYGGPITAIVGRDNIVGTQFHPEKSQAPRALR